MLSPACTRGRCEAIAAKGDISANTRLGYHYLTVSAGVINSVQAYNFFTAVAPKSLAASAWAGYPAATRSELAGKNIDGLAIVNQAANAGDPIGLTLLGFLYSKGNGLPGSYPQAVTLFRRAALAGYALAQAELGICYGTGKGVEKDISLAIYWLSLAAPRFDFAAQQLAQIQKGQLR